MNAPIASLCCTLAATATPVIAQARPSGPDLRDHLTLSNGTTLRGRVLRAHEPDTIVLIQAAGRRHIPRDKITAMTRVHDAMTELLASFDRHRANPKLRWMLAEWATSRQLPGMARALALQTVFRDPTHTAAHRLLQHRLVRGTWLWPLGDRMVKKKAFLAYGADMGHPFTLTGEHFTIATAVRPDRAVRSLLDLERLYLFWMQRFGKLWRMREALRPMEIRIWPDARSMPGYSDKKVAFHETHCGADYGATHYLDDQRGAARLLMLGSQMILAHCVAGRADVDGRASTHSLPWLELGLAQWVESHFQGAPGSMKPGKPRLSAAVRQLVRENPVPLRKLVRFPHDRLIANRGKRATLLAHCHALTHYLMSAKSGLLGNTERYVFTAIGEQKGSSSSVFKKHFTTSLERIEKGFREFVK